MNFLSGKKTYIICAITIIWAIVGLSLGKMELVEFTELLGVALIGAGLRKGIN